jgi:hypothetical protein
MMVALMWYGEKDDFWLIGLDLGPDCDDKEMF